MEVATYPHAALWTIFCVAQKQAGRKLRRLILKGTRSPGCRDRSNLVEPCTNNDCNQFGNAQRLAWRVRYC
jgi:hypothetical protein